MNKLDNNGLPDSNQEYNIPESFKYHYSNYHNKGVYSLWNHFVEFCAENKKLEDKNMNIEDSEYFGDYNRSYNRHLIHCKRLDVFLEYSNQSTLKAKIIENHEYFSPTCSETIVEKMNDLYDDTLIRSDSDLTLCQYESSKTFSPSPYFNIKGSKDNFNHSCLENFWDTPHKPSSIMLEDSENYFSNYLSIEDFYFIPIEPWPKEI